MYMFVVLMLKPFSRVSSVDLGAMVSGQGNMLKSVVVGRERHVVAMLMVWYSVIRCNWQVPESIRNINKVEARGQC